MSANRVFGLRRLALFIAPTVALAVTLLYQILFFPSVFEKIVTSLVRGATDAELTISFERASLFFGFRARDILLTDSVSRTTIFRAEQINLSFFLPSVLAGHAGIRDLTLLKPEIHLDYADGRWNYESLIPRSSTVTEEPIVAPSPIPERISLFFPVKLYANMTIVDLSLRYTESHGNSKTFFRIGNVDFIATIITSTFREIPISSDALNLLDTFVVALNPFEKPEFEYGDSFRLNGFPELSLLLFHDRGSGETDFSSRLRVDSDRSAIFRNDHMPLPLGLSADYFMMYNSVTNSLDVRTFRIAHQGDPLLSFTARIGNIQDGTGEFDIAVNRTRIDLYRIASLLDPFIGDPRFRLGGIVESGPFLIAGKPESLRIAGRLRAKNFVYADGSENHVIPYLNTDVDALIDAHVLLPFLTRPAHYRKSRLAFGLFHRLHMNELTGYYNGAFIRSSIRIDPKTGINAGIFLSNFEIGTVAAPDLTGRCLLDISFHSPESFDRIGIRGRILLQNARYYIGRSVSTEMNLSIDTDAVLHLTEEITEIDFNSIRLNGEDEERKSFMEGSAKGVLAIGENIDFNGFFHDLFLNGAVLFPVLPADLQHELDPIRVYISRGLRLTSSRLGLHLTPTVTSVSADLLIDIPYLRLSDLFVNMDLSMTETLFDLRSFRLSALQNTMNASASGSIRFLKDRTIPSIRGEFSLNESGPIRVHNNLTLSGGLDVNFKAMPDRADANIKIRNLNLLYEDTECNGESSDCSRYQFDSLNFELPIHHIMKPSAKHEIAMNTAPVPDIPTYRDLSPNLDLKFISSSRNPRGESVRGYYYYLGTDEREQSPGLSANIEYVNNTLKVNNLKIRIYHGDGRGDPKKWRDSGIIDGENLYLDLSDLNPENMGFGGSLHIKRFDLEPYMPRSRSRYDGVISADLTVSGKNLDAPLYETSARLSVHRLSPQFSGFATRIVMPDRITAGMVQGTLKIPSILLELRGGMVYSRISIERGGIFPGAFIRPSGEEISQERIPIAVFLERARSEARTFTE